MGQADTISKVVSIRESIFEGNPKGMIRNVEGKVREFKEAKDV